MAVGLAGYRIVQEALTNAVRHSGAAVVTVEVRCLPGEVWLLVEDDGSGPAADGNAEGTGCGACGSGRRRSAGS